VRNDSVFVDWVALSQLHPQGGLPVIVDGVVASFDAGGNCRFERGIPARHRGSFETTVGVRCDGFRVSLSGNVGRFDRPDNLFNLGWSDTFEACQRILAAVGLPPFTPGAGAPGSDGVGGGSPDGGEVGKWGAFVSRLDLTVNYRTGSDAQARSVIRWLAGQSVARMKRGYSGDESVWFSNTRHMLKAYRKGAEMKKHGGASEAQEWAEDSGIVRVEVELKKRLLSDLGLNRIEDISDERLAAVFADQTEIFRRVDMTDEPDILECVPARSRAYAAAWLAGVDVRGMMTNGTLYRHAKVLREHGLDILEPRNIERFPVRVRVVDLEPAEAPAWHWTQKAAA